MTPLTIVMIIPGALMTMRCNRLLSTARRSPSRRRVGATGAVLAASACLVLAGTGVSSAESASSGLTLNVRPAPSFVVGKAGYTVDVCQQGNPVYSGAHASLYYTASAPSGISHFEISEEYDGDEGSPVRYPGATSASIAFDATNYDGTCGGGSQVADGYKITAYDKAGHSVTKYEEYSMAVTEWNNENITGDHAVNTWTFSAGWGVSNCSCFDNGSTADTVTAGASATYTATQVSGGEHLGLMMAESNTRGQAQIYLDGELVTTVNTDTSSKLNRIYVWDSGPLAKGKHTVKVVNLGTAGHPRIDINAMSELYTDVT